jgi:two-component system nitrate/nitrite response regulator NarL
VTAASTRVLVADRQPLYGAALAQVIEQASGHRVVGHTTDGQRALEMIRTTLPDIVTLDISLHRLTGLAVLNGIVRDGLPTRALFVTNIDHPAVVYEAFASGALGYLTKRASGGEEVHNAIAAILSGGVAFSQAGANALSAAIRRQADDTERRLDGTTREILALTATGQSISAIAAELHFSPATIKMRLRRVYKRLGVNNRTAAVAEALRRGLID